MTRECAEIAESEYLKKKQKESVPDNNFLSKCNYFFSLYGITKITKYLREDAL